VRSNPSFGLILAAALPLAALACKSDYRKVGDAPFEAYKPGEYVTGKGKKLTPPEIVDAPWRVMVIQEQPRQKKNPQWKVVAPNQSGFLDMPDRSSFKCLYNPVVYRPWGDEYMKSVETWDVIRGVRCSNDGFRTYSEALHVKVVSGDGSKVVNAIPQTQLSLHDVIRGKPVEITIILRPQ
jgi:hypothetical protein